MQDIWVVAGRSESGDHYILGYWLHIPTEFEIKTAFANDEEFTYFTDYYIEKLTSKEGTFLSTG